MRSSKPRSTAHAAALLCATSAARSTTSRSTASRARAASASRARPTRGAAARSCAGPIVSHATRASIPQRSASSASHESWMRSMAAERDARLRSRPRRVLMTADTIGGVWTYAIELCRELAARDHEILLATMGAIPTREQRREALAIEGVELCPSAYKLIWMDDPWRDVDAAENWLKGLAARFKPDIVHLNDLGHGDLECSAPRLVVGHSCVLSWWQAVHGEPAPREWSRYYRRVRANLRAADLVVAPSEAMLGALERHYGPLPATRVIANGKRARRSTVLEKSPLVFSAGRVWDEGKNIATLARAAPRIAWPVAVAGENRRADGTTVVLDGVKLLGLLDRDALAEWYARASIYVAPARYEPFGL